MLSVKDFKDFGWSDDRNIRYDYRWGDGNADRGKALAAELVQ